MIVNASCTTDRQYCMWTGIQSVIFFCSSLNTVIPLIPVKTDATVSLVYTSHIITFALSSTKKNSSRCWQIDMNSWHQGRLETEMQTEHSNVVWDVNIYQFLRCFYPFKVRFRYWFDLSVYVSWEENPCPCLGATGILHELQENVLWSVMIIKRWHFWENYLSFNR